MSRAAPSDYSSSASSPSTPAPAAMQFEGGDIVMQAPYIFIGVSHPDAEHGEATSMTFIKQLQSTFPQYTVVPVPLAQEVLHLDLTFNILPFGNACVVYDRGITDWPGFKKTLERVFSKIYVVTQDQFEAYACNFINTGPDRMIVSASKPMAKLLEKWRKDNPKLQADAVEFEWIYSYLGGSIRCSTLPIVRSNSIARPTRPNVTDETTPLRACLVGRLTTDKLDAVCQEAYGSIAKTLEADGNTRKQLLSRIDRGLEQLAAALESHGVTVLRPDPATVSKVQACSVIFCRDIAAVIGSEIIQSQLHLEHRKDEFEPSRVAISQYFAPVPAVSYTTVAADDLSEMTIPMLKQLVNAKGLDIPGIGKLRKAELVAAIGKALGRSGARRTCCSYRSGCLCRWRG